MGTQGSQHDCDDLAEKSSMVSIQERIFDL